MRAASATGALYPIELYVISSRMPGLEAGVYHFNPLHFSLVKLREGDYRSVLVDAGSHDSVSAPFTLAFSSLAWRNAWKYEARSYRHWFWDSGVIIANLLATSSAAGLSTKVVLGFVDSTVDRLLGLEVEKEATVALAAVGNLRGEQLPRTAQQTPQLSLEINPLSREETGYPIIWETNEASKLKSKSETESWKESLRVPKRTLPTNPLSFPLHESDEDIYPPLDEVILLRGSTRKFARLPISFDHLSTIIRASATSIPLDFLRDDETLIDFYLIANDVQGLAPGSYFYNPETHSVEQLKTLKNRSMSGYLCLGQQLFSDASAVFFLMTDLTLVLKSLGNRGYRAAQLEAGIRAGKIYLSAYAVGLGASGSTFFDDAVTEFFSPHARDKSTMIAVGIGKPAYKARPGKILLKADSNK
jgi:SagB-type dehydrogenase family enzyme